MKTNFWIGVIIIFLVCLSLIGLIGFYKTGLLQDKLINLTNERDDCYHVFGECVDTATEATDGWQRCIDYLESDTYGNN